MREGPAAQQPSLSCFSARLWLRLAAAGEEAGVAVAGVAGLEAGRLALSRGRAERLLAVAPVLRRRAAGTGEAGTVAVLQPGERADGVGVGRTQAFPPWACRCR